jgi:hypothetical protein
MNETIDDTLKTMYGFKGPLTKEQESLIAVAKLLSDKSIVVEQLHKLESLLAAKRESLKEGKKDTSHVDTSSPPRFKDYKFLSSILYEYLNANGFSESVVLGNEVVARDTVLSYFEQGSLFKDQVARKAMSHGEWTHIIQWFILTEAHKAYNLLSVTPVDLLKWIGKDDRNREVSLWDLTFESVNFAFKGVTEDTEELKASVKYQPEFDARSFSKLFVFLLGEEGEKTFPLLHHAMVRRGRKYSERFFAGFLNSSYSSEPHSVVHAKFALKHGATPEYFLSNEDFSEKKQNFIAFLIDTCGMDVNLSINGRSLLTVACEANNFRAAEFLIKRGAKAGDLPSKEQEKLKEKGITVSTIGPKI